ncbi:MAG TPA: hypothetical protein PLQ88_05275, partial [Blastocatellia bacterium]|nr:hypothetical protein [Blastocatellia bacterium]
MADQFYSSAGSEPVEGAVRNFSDLTIEEITSSLEMSPSRPEWMKTRFPVSMEEYRRLEVEARQPDAAPTRAAAAVIDAQSDQTSDDVDQAVASASQDVPEDEAQAAAPQPLAPGFVANFDAIPQTQFTPPDCTVAVGPQHVMTAVNVELAVYGKNGAFQFRWPGMSALFAPVLPAGAQLFDPQVIYDHYAGRWVVVVAARRNSPPGSWIMLAASQNNNPAGPYRVWALDARLDGSAVTNNWADYPMLGFDTQALYISMNMFQFGGGFQYSKLRILNKAQVYAGGVISWFDFWNLRNPDNSVAFTVLPAKHFRGVGGNPPAYLLNALWPDGDKVTKWTLNNPIGFWTGGAATLARNFINCRSYSLPPDALQPGTATRIETNDTRLLQVVFQNAGGVQRLWACHTTRISWPGDSEARSAVQWYEIDVPTNAVVQQNAYGQSGKYYFFPTLHTDFSRNLHLLTGRSGSTEFAQLRQTGRLVADPANSLQASALVVAGLGAYTGGRWGDYFGS